MRWIFYVLIALLLSASSTNAQGRLSQIRDKVDPPPSSRDEEEEEDDHTHHDCCCDEDEDDGIFGPIIAELFFSPFTVPHALTKDSLEIEGLFPPYPYAKPFEGYIQRSKKFSEEEKELLGTIAGRFSVEQGSDFRGLHRTNFHMLIETMSRFGIQTRFDYLYEDTGFGKDELYLGTTELTFRFAQCSSFQSFAGIGLRYINERDKNHFGFNFTYAFDVFPVKPYVMSVIFDLGTIGSATVIHIRGTFGVLWKGIEFFGGYDYRSFDGVGVKGPFLGLRYWF